MPTRKVLTNGWLFWLARHNTLGLVLLDEFNQSNVDPKNLRAFIYEKLATAEFDRLEFKQQLSSSVSDRDFVEIVRAYNEYKRVLGLPIKAELDIAHANFLRKRGLSAYGVRRRTLLRNHRTTHCWACRCSLDNNVDIECINCDWIICLCGACGCGRDDP